MKPGLRFGVVILAAGRSSRFGSNKLLADLGGKTVIEHALALARSCGAVRAAVVAADPGVIRLAASYQIEVVINDDPSLGQAHSIALGVSSMKELDAVLLMAGDQPLLSDASLEKLICAFASSDQGAACLKDSTHFGNPAIFSAAYFAELIRLSGDCGAKRILRAHEEDLLIVSCIGENELADADTPEELERLKARYHE